MIVLSIFTCLFGGGIILYCIKRRHSKRDAYNEIIHRVIAKLCEMDTIVSKAIDDICLCEDKNLDAKIQLYSQSNVLGNYFMRTLSIMSYPFTPSLSQIVQFPPSSCKQCNFFDRWKDEFSKAITYFESSNKKYESHKLESRLKMNNTIDYLKEFKNLNSQLYYIHRIPNRRRSHIIKVLLSVEKSVDVFVDLNINADPNLVH